MQPVGGEIDTAGGIGTGAGGNCTTALHTVGGRKVTPGTNGELTPPEGVTDGRSVFEPRLRLKSVPVMTVKGRPEEASTMGTTVHSAKNLRQERVDRKSTRPNSSHVKIS